MNILLKSCAFSISSQKLVRVYTQLVGAGEEEQYAGC